MIITKTRPERSINKVFDELFNGYPYNWNKEVRSESFTPSVNIAETVSAYLLEVNAPGRNKEEFKLNVENGLLTISYDQKQEAENKEFKIVRREFNYRSFKRSFSLDEKINAEAIEARYENGILKVTLPKKEEVKPAVTQIKIQ